MKSKPAILIYFSCLFAAALVFSFPWGALAEKKATPKHETAKKPTKPVKKDADFWFKKGALLSTYGNHKAAVQYFQKAISFQCVFFKLTYCNDCMTSSLSFILRHETRSSIRHNYYPYQGSCFLY